MKIKKIFVLCVIFYFHDVFGCRFVRVVPPSDVQGAGAAAAAAAPAEVIQIVPRANLFEFIFGMSFDAFCKMMPLSSEGSQKPLLVLSTDHVFDVRNRRFFLKTGTGSYGCGRCELLSHQELAAVSRLRFERFLQGGASLRTGHFHVIEAQNIDETSPFWHRVSMSALMAKPRHKKAVFQIFESPCDSIARMPSSCFATLPACMYRIFLKESRPTPRSLVYQHDVQVVYGQAVEGGVVYVCEQDQIVDLAVCAALDPDDEQLEQSVLATYQAVLQAAFCKEKKQLVCVIPPHVTCFLVAQALVSLKFLMRESDVEITLVWHSTGAEDDGAARNVLTHFVNQMDGTYEQYRQDGMYKLYFDSSTPGSPQTPVTTGVIGYLGHRPTGVPFEGGRV